MNGGGNALGQGNRANLTIGRAVQLVVRNVGGGRPGEVDRATHGNPGKISFCFAELEDGVAVHVARRRAAASRPRDDTVTVFAGEGPRCIVDQKARDRRRAGQHVRRVPAHAAQPEAGPRLRHRARGRPRARPRVRRRRLGPRAACSPNCTPGCNSPGSELVRGAGGIADGVPAAPAATPRCRSSAPTASCWSTPAAAPACSRR